MLRTIGLQEAVAAQEEEDLQPDLAQTSRSQVFRRAIPLRPATVEAQDILLRMGNTIHNNSSTSSQAANMGEDNPKVAMILTTSRDLTISDWKSVLCTFDRDRYPFVLSVEGLKG
jgi:hypothetical protein